MADNEDKKVRQLRQEPSADAASNELPTQRMRIHKGVIAEDMYVAMRGNVYFVRVKPVKWKTLVDHKLVTVRGYKVWYAAQEVDPVPAPSEDATLNQTLNS